MWIHPILDRALSIREAARLQTFPDSFIFYGRGHCPLDGSNPQVHRRQDVGQEDSRVVGRSGGSP